MLQVKKNCILIDEIGNKRIALFHLFRIRLFLPTAFPPCTIYLRTRLIRLLKRRLWKTMSKYFYGHYFKLQSASNTIAFIPSYAKVGKAYTASL